MAVPLFFEGEKNMTAKSIGFIGGGRITRVFLTALGNKTLPLDRITVSDNQPDVLSKLKAAFPAITTTPDNRQPAAMDIVFVALHPPAIKGALPEVSASLHSQSIVISLAPVFTFAKLADLLGGFKRIVRLIPNAPSIVHSGYNPVSYSQAIAAGEKADIEAMIEPLGSHPIVPEETLEAYAVIAAMGPTYFWFQWQTLRQLAATFGLGQADADAALASMLHGSIKTLFDSGLSYEAVCDLIPVKPLAEKEAQIQQAYEETLTKLYSKLKGA
jgi:pyrroline-5-carboxylate reductase